jgi:hypothetical protein
MADEPVIAAAMNLMIAMIKLPMMAATTAILESPCVATCYFSVGRGSRRQFPARPFGLEKYNSLVYGVLLRGP